MVAPIIVLAYRASRAVREEAASAMVLRAQGGTTHKRP